MQFKSGANFEGPRFCLALNAAIVCIPHLISLRLCVAVRFDREKVCEEKETRRVEIE